LINKEKPLQPYATTVFSKWGLEDSNLRPLRCQRVGRYLRKST